MYIGSLLVLQLNHILIHHYSTFCHYKMSSVPTINQVMSPGGTAKKVPPQTIDNQVSPGGLMPMGSPDALSFGSAMMLAEHRAEAAAMATAETEEEARQEAEPTHQIPEARFRGAPSQTGQAGGETVHDLRQMEQLSANPRGSSVSSRTRSQARLAETTDPRDSQEDHVRGAAKR